MNWSKIKNILIGLFLCLNIFLFVVLFITQRGSEYADPEVIDASVRVLRANNIEIDPEIIPKKNAKLENVYVSSAVSSADGFAERLLGEWSYRKNSGSEIIYTSNGKELTVNGNSFKYTSGAAPTDKTDAELVKYAKKMLTQRGFNMKNAVALKIRGNEVKFGAEYKKYPIFESSIYAKVGEGDFISLEGLWMAPVANPVSGVSTFSLRHVSTIFPEFINDPERAATSKRIVGIDLGYSLFLGGSDYREAAAVPAWRITTDDGCVYYYDAR